MREPNQQEGTALIELIGEHATLVDQPSGDLYRYVCPLCKARFLRASSATAIFYCTGCFTGGDLYDAYILIAKLPAEEALERFTALRTTEGETSP